jgi:effector-binding domain-containing protein
VHHGRYEEITRAYHTLTSWVVERCHEITGPPREIYLNDPQTEAPDDLRTRVEFAIGLADQTKDIPA